MTQTDPVEETCPKLQAERGKRNLESSSAVITDSEMSKAK